jgi:hypothetical protein
MMSRDISKRQFIAGAGVSAAAAAIAAGQPWATVAARKDSVRPALAIYDSRLPESVHFSAQAKADGLRLFDIAQEDETLWVRGRAGFGLAKGEAAAGMTRWSDWLVIRDLLSERGRRVRQEMRMDCCATGEAASFARLMTAPGKRSRTDIRSATRATLFAWTMA